MTVRRLAVLQWVGLLLGSVTWTLAHLTGIGVTQWECNAVGEHWGLSNPWTQGTLTVVSCSLVLAAGACAAVVFLRTRGTPFGDGPPEGEGRRESRIHFFSAAALATNAILLMIILLDGAANLADIACRQS
jgi:hypothetical protein